MKIYSEKAVTTKIKKERNEESKKLLVKFFNFITSCRTKRDVLKEAEVTAFNHDILYKRINSCFLIFSIQDENAVLLDYVKHGRL